MTSYYGHPLDHLDYDNEIHDNITFQNDGTYYTNKDGSLTKYCNNIGISTGGITNTHYTTGTWVNTEVDELRRELEETKALNKQLMEKLFWLIENPEKLEEFPALKEAYKEYLLVRKLILGE